MSSDRAIATAWRLAAADPLVRQGLLAVFDSAAAEIASRGPACWASGRCCNFRRTGHLLYVTGLEAAYTVLMLDARARRDLPGALGRARLDGGCPFQLANLCGAHAIKPLGCRLYFCDRGAQQWQQDLSERLLAELRDLHDRAGIPYRYGEWRSMLEMVVGGADGV